MDRRIYPNLPGVTTYISEVTQEPQIPIMNPVFLIVGTHDKDQFDDGTPILFNEPYYLPVESMISQMFGASSKLGTAQLMATRGSAELLTPVVVRMGVKNPKIGGAQPAANNKYVCLNSGATISWDVADWPANFKLTVSVSDTGVKSVKLNDQELEIVDDKVQLPQYGLSIDLSTVPPEALDVVDEVEVQGYKQPATDDEVQAALKDQFDVLLGFEYEYVYSPDQKFDDNVSDDANRHVKLLQNFAQVSSTQFHQCMAYVGTNLPAQFTYTALKSWINRLTTRQYYNTGLFDENGVDIGKHVVVIPAHGSVAGIAGTMNDVTPYVQQYIYQNKLAGSPTNMSLPGVTLVESITYEMANQLSGQRLTPLYNKVSGFGTGGVTVNQTVILVGRTGQLLTSNFTKISTVLVANDYVQSLREMSMRFVGRPNNGLTRMQLESSLKEVTNGFVSAGRIQNGSVSVEPATTGGIINTVNVHQLIYAWSELEAVNIDVAFQFTA